MAGTTGIREWSMPSAVDLRTIYDDLICTRFPPDERVAFESLVQAVQDGDTTVWYVAATGTADFQPLGVAVVDHFSEVDLLSYLASVEAVAGQGIGEGLAQHAASTSRDAGKLLFGEVEDPRTRASGQYGDPALRVKLYDRHGVKVLVDVPYYVPQLRPDSARVPDVLLCVMTPLQEDHLQAAPVHRFLTEYLDSVPEPAHDPGGWRARLMASVSAGTIELRPIGHYLR